MFTGPAEWYEDDLAIRMKLKKRGDDGVQTKPVRRVVKPTPEDRRQFVLDAHKDCSKFRAFIAAACSYTGTTESELFGTGRSSHTSYTRKLIAWFTHRQLGKSYHWVGRKLLRDHSTIVYIIQDVEAKWPQFEAQIRNVAEMIGHEWVVEKQ